MKKLFFVLLFSTLAIAQGGTQVVIRDWTDPTLRASVNASHELKVTCSTCASGTVNQGTAAATHASPWWVRPTDGTVDLTFGQQTMANSMPVVLSSDQTAVAITQNPSAAAAAATSSYVSAALEASHAAIKSGAGNLYGITVYTTNAAKLLIQCADSTTVPADGAVTPIVTFVVDVTPNNGGWSPNAGGLPKAFSTGLSCWASTATTTPYTKALASASIVFHVAYK